MQVPGVSFQRRCVCFPSLCLRKALEHLPSSCCGALSALLCRAVPGPCAGVCFLPAPVGRAVQVLGFAIPIRNASGMSDITKCEHANYVQSSQQRLASCGLMSSFRGLGIVALFKTGSETSFLKEAQNPLTMLEVTSLLPRADRKGAAWLQDLQLGGWWDLLRIFLY